MHKVDPKRPASDLAHLTCAMASGGPTLLVELCRTALMDTVRVREVVMPTASDIMRCE